MNDPPKRALVDDPQFLARLSELDRGISEMDDPAEEPSDAPPSPPPSPPQVRMPLPPLPAPIIIPGRRPLLDLFPALPGESAALQPVPPPTAPVPSPPAAAARATSLPRMVARQPTPPVVEAPPAPLTYEPFFGLDEAAFALSSDPKFLYRSVTHDRVAQELLHAIRRRDGIVLLTGDEGLGKTTLCRAVIEQLDRRTLTSFVDQPFVSAEQLLQTVLLDLGVVSRADAASGHLLQASRADLSLALRDFLSTLPPLQAFAVVIIDEAQNLPVDMLQQIGVLVASDGDQQLLQVILVGEPTLRPLLAKPALKEVASRITVRCSLGRLAADEVGAYIAHRLAVAGLSPRVEFEDPAVARIHELSDGVPQVVNLICDRALSRAHAVAATQIDDTVVNAAARDLEVEPPGPAMSPMRKAVIAILLLLLMAIGAGAAAYLFRAELGQLITAP